MKLHYLSLARTQLRQPVERRIKRDKLRGISEKGHAMVIQADSLLISAAALRPMAARMIHQDSPHTARHRAQQVPTILPTKFFAFE
jgi:hypothetical protein